MAFQLLQIAEYNKLFPEKTETIANLCEGIPRLLFLQMATTFLQKDPDNPENSNWKKALRNWFRDANTPFYNDVCRRIYMSYGSQANYLRIYFPIADLKILQLGYQLPDVPRVTPFTEELVEINLFKIYLLISQKVAENHIPDSQYIEANYPEHVLPCLMVSMSFPSSEFLNFSFDRELYCQNTKAFFLFAFLKKNPIFDKIVKDVCKKYEIDSIVEYYGLLKPFLQAMKSHSTEGFLEFNIKKDQFYNRNKAFLQCLSMFEYSPEDDIDFKELRQQPFVPMGYDRYRISLPIFFSDKIYKGLVFEMFAANDRFPKEDKIDFRSRFGLEFSEKFLFYRIMEYSHSNVKIKFSGEDLANLGIHAAPDFYLRCGKAIFIFENKDVLIPAKVKSDSNFQSLEEELKKKLFKDGKKPKGIAQLVNSIDALLNREYFFDAIEDFDGFEVYPVLVLQDISFDCPGLNSLLNCWFQNDLLRLKMPGRKLPIIKPLIALSADTLICMSELLKSSKTTLKAAFDNYFKKTRIYPNKIFRTEEERKLYISNSYINPGNIIENWLREIFPRSYPINNLISYSQSLMKDE